MPPYAPHEVMPPPRWLIHDEVEEFTSKNDNKYQFRVRVWLGQGATPVVLVNQVILPDGKLGIQPRLMTCRVANYCHSALVGFDTKGMLYFEARQDTHPKIHQIFFEYFGFHHRTTLFKPEAQQREWLFLEHIIQSTISL